MNPGHELAGVDLNLLVALDALIRERSVTRAARRAGITQSAMSHTLRRLRALFSDPLLVRAGGAMALTPRAEQLALNLRSGLRTLARVLEEPVFDPATSRRGFRLATVDLVDVLVLPRLLRVLREEAPGVDLTVVSTTGAGIGPALAAGDIDAAVLARPQLDETPGLVGRTLLRDSLSCFLRPDHPAIARWSLESYARADHALVSPRGEGPGVVDAFLAERGLTRRVALRLPTFYGALRIVHGSDLVLTGPASLVRFLPPDGGLVSRALPIEVPPHSVACFWHDRFTADRAHAWLRERLVDVTAGLGVAAS